MNRKRHLFVLLVAVVSLCWASQAFAQQKQQLDPGNIAFLSSSSSSTPFLTTSSTASVAIKARESELKEDIDRLESIVRLRLYLNDNERQVRTAIAIGGGSSLKEMATLINASIKITAANAKQVRKRRKTFDEILNKPESFDRAAALYDVLKPALTITNVHFLAVVPSPTKKKGQQ